MISSDAMTRILLAAWERQQNLAASLDASAWKIRGFGFGVWAALMAYSFKSAIPFISLLGAIFLVIIFLTEMGVRRLQYAFIRRSFAVEKGVQSLLLGDIDRAVTTDISTRIANPRISDYKFLLSAKRWLNWFPYLVAAVVSLAMYFCLG